MKKTKYINHVAAEVYMSNTREYIYIEKTKMYIRETHSNKNSNNNDKRINRF